MLIQVIFAVWWYSKDLNSEVLFLDTTFKCAALDSMLDWCSQVVGKPEAAQRHGPLRALSCQVPVLNLKCREPHFMGTNIFGWGSRNCLRDTRLFFNSFEVLLAFHTWDFDFCSKFGLCDEDVQTIPHVILRSLCNSRSLLQLEKCVAVRIAHSGCMSGDWNLLTSFWLLVLFWYVLLKYADEYTDIT